MKTFKGNCESLLNKGYQVNLIHLTRVGHKYIGHVTFIKQTTETGVEIITLRNHSSRFDHKEITSYAFLWEQEKETIIPYVRNYRDIIKYAR